jgi:hypothetical protein
MLQVAQATARRRRIRCCRSWTPAEDAALRDLYPDYEGILLKLPHRTYYALRGRAAALGCTALTARHKWTGAELTKLKKSCETGTSRRDLMALFPHATRWSQLQNKIRYYGYHRQNFKFKSTGFPIIDEIRERARQMNISMVELDALAKSGCYFLKAAWLNQGIVGKHIYRAIEALGGHLSVDWDPLTED